MNIRTQFQSIKNSPWFMRGIIVFLFLSTVLLTGYLYNNSLPPFPIRATTTTPTPATCSSACLEGCVGTTSTCKPYCSLSKLQSCSTKCIPSASGGSCAPTCPSSCLEGCITYTATCKPYCSLAKLQTCTTPCTPSATGGSCSTAPSSGSGSSTSNCTNTWNGTYYILGGAPCNGPGAGVSCGGKNYICPGKGQQWVIQGTSTLTNPRPITSVAQTPGGAQTPPSYNPSSGSAPVANCPPQQKQAKAKTKPGSTPASSAGSTACNDLGCSNIQQGTSWGITNCGTGDPDGDIQICDAKGRIGICQEKQLCCPGPGQKWTADMAACPITNANIAVSPATIQTNQNLTITFSSIPAPSAKDWIGLYESGEKDERNPIDWNYVHSSGTCTKTPGDAKSSGTCSFPIVSSVPSGQYELRLFSSDTFAKVATSTLFTVQRSNFPTPTTNSFGTPTPTPSKTCCACSAPTPVFTQSTCNGPCMTSQNCSNGQVCLLMNSVGWVCRSAACVTSASCSCSAVPNTTTTLTPTITPTPKPQTAKAVCGEVCTSNTQCRTGYQCVYINNQEVAICRNTKCLLSSNCTCPKPVVVKTTTNTTTSTTTSSPPKGGAAVYISPFLTPSPGASPSAGTTATISGTLTPTPTGIRIDASPSALPIPTPMPINPALTIKSFTDGTGKAPQKFTLSGTSDPSADISIRFSPDGIGTTTTADSKGDWRYILTKSLTTGNKELTVTATNNDGGETQVKQSFSVKTSGSFLSLFLGFFLLAIFGGIGFIIYQKQMNNQSNLFSEFPPIASDAPSEPPIVSAEEPTLTPELQPEMTSTEVFSEAPSDSQSPISEDVPTTSEPVATTGTTEPIKTEGVQTSKDIFNS